MDKRRLIRELVDGVRREIAVQKRAANSAREAATHEEARPENDKDTRAVEAAYLASGQAERVRSLEAVANALEFLVLRAFSADEAISAGALVELEKDGETLTAFMAPDGGGLEAALDGKRIQVVTPRSPLGQVLLGKCAGEEFELRERAYAVLSVS